MQTKIEIPTIGEVIMSQFLAPKEMIRICATAGIDYADLEEVIMFKKPLTKELSNVLEKYYGMSDGYFMRLQEKLKDKDNKQ